MINPEIQPLSRWRDDTPGVKDVIHLNNAGASLMPTPVIMAIKDYLEEEIHYGGYETAAKYRKQLDKTYHSLANLINAKPEEIAILENATAAWRQAFLSLSFSAGDVILTSKAEYASNYIAYLQMQKRKGVNIKVIPNDSYGQVDIGALKAMINQKTKLISITHIPTNGGLVNPAKEIGKIARKNGVLYLLDACQSVGQLPLDVRELGCDFLSATGRKYLRGPRGTGFLFVNKELLPELEPIALDLHSAKWTSISTYEMRPDARRFEDFESNMANQLGLGAAAEYAQSQGLELIWNRIKDLASLLRSSLEAIDGVKVHDLGKVKGGIVSFTLKNWPAEKLSLKLRQEKINVSVIVPEGTLVDMQARSLGNMIRASVHYYNSEEEIHKFCEILQNLSSARR